MLTFSLSSPQANGDIEGASMLYTKAVELSPSDPLVLSTFAHFLAQEASFSSGPNSVNRWVKFLTCCFAEATMLMCFIN